MRILFVSEGVVEKCNNQYYKTNFSSLVERYNYFGSVYLCCYKKEVDVPNQPLMVVSPEKYIFCEKENKISTLISVRRKNKKKLREAISECDIVVSHLPSRIGIYAIQIDQKMRKPYFLGVVGCAFEALWNYNWKGRIIAIPTYLQVRYWVSKSKFIFYVTQSYLQKKYPSKGVSIGCSNVELYPVSHRILDEKLRKISENREMKRLNIVTVGAVDVRYKGQRIVIEALSKLKKLNCKFHYFLVGGGNIDELEKYARKYGVQEQIHFVGKLSPKKLFVFLDSMDLYIQSSFTEGLPRSLVEAMSRALPCLGTKVGGIPELLPDIYLYERQNVLSLVELLEALNAEEMLKMARENYLKATEYYFDELKKKRELFFDKIIDNYCNNEKDYSNS